MVDKDTVRGPELRQALEDWNETSLLLRHAATVLVEQTKILHELRQRLGIAENIVPLIQKNTGFAAKIKSRFKVIKTN